MKEKPVSDPIVHEKIKNRPMIVKKQKSNVSFFTIKERSVFYFLSSGRTKQLRTHLTKNFFHIGSSSETGFIFASTNTGKTGFWRSHND